ncbi:MAG: hypothetical protein EP344_16510 [Bacteroidetes bacterium]|nr:MAG: hypothetical protein EP344_16510 [Bacteroidota bacterium]
MNFDQKMKQALENLEPEYDPNTWTMLEQRMDTLVATEQPAPVDAVDKAVYHRLDRMEVPYEAAHWNMLKQRMLLQHMRIRKLHVAKIAEIALLLLLCWNVDLFLGDQSKTPRYRQPDPRIPVAALQPGQQATPVGRAASGAPDGFEPVQSRYAAAALQELLSSGQAFPLLSAEYRTAGSVVDVLEGLNALAIESGKRIYAATDLLPYDALSAFPVPERAMAFNGITEPVGKRVKPFYMSVYGTVDHNTVLVNGSRRNSGGYGAGIAAGYRGKKWGAEGGFSIVHKQYTPKQEVEIYGGNLTDGYYGSRLTDVNTDLVSVPVKVTRRVAHLGKMSVHATAGMTANFAAQKNYDYGTVYYAPDALPPNFLPDPSQTPKLRKSGKGILENGTVSQNIYATLDAGIRLERPIANGRYTAFVEPAVRRTIGGKGIGPGREPINTLSLQAGIMAYL